MRELCYRGMDGWQGGDWFYLTPNQAKPIDGRPCLPAYTQKDPPTNNLKTGGHKAGSPRALSRGVAARGMYARMQGMAMLLVVMLFVVCREVEQARQRHALCVHALFYCGWGGEKDIPLRLRPGLTSLTIHVFITPNL